MMTMNRILIIGRLGQDPELRNSQAGNAWMRLRVATDRARKEGDEWVQETDWHDVKIFGRDAERAHRLLRKGSLVAVDGTLVYERWTDKSDQRRYSPKIIAERFNALADLRPLESRPAPAGPQPVTAGAQA